MLTPTKGMYIDVTDSVFIVSVVTRLGKTLQVFI